MAAALEPHVRSRGRSALISTMNRSEDDLYQPHPERRYRLLSRPNDSPNLSLAALRMVEAGRRLDAFVTAERKVYDDWSINVVARAHQDDLEGSVTLDGLDALRQSAHITEPASMQVSELLHHCRTALDYCIHAVAWIDSGRANPRTQFPMCATPAKWGEALRGKWLRGLSSQHLGWVKDVQPYSSVEWTKSLSLLSNQDKHRSISWCPPG